MKHQVFDWVSNESPQFANLLGDEKPELICTRDGFFGFVTIDWKKPLQSWTFHPISERIAPEKFGHGLGIGDINGDGRMDILRASGWFEQPASNAEGQRWREHKVKFTNAGGGAEMYAYDVDGDGDNDVITSLAAHDFGLSWFEQSKVNGEIEFEEHRIMGNKRSENKYGLLFSELHSVALADIDGDGLKDIVTGKTYYSHHKQSPMWDAGPVVYWFKLVRNKDGVDWIPYQADGQSGIGRQIVVQDINQDGLLDIASGGMLGAHVLLHKKTPSDEKTWLAAQPKLFDPSLESPLAPSSGRGAGGEGSSSVTPIPATTAIDGRIEGESLSVKTTGGSTKTQGMANFKADRWSSDKQLWWTGAQPGHRLTTSIASKSHEKFLEVVLTKARNYGIVQLRLDDKLLGPPIDLYSPDVRTTGSLRFPLANPQSGAHELSIEITGANPNAQQAYMVGIDFVRFSEHDEPGAKIAGVTSQPRPLSPKTGRGEMSIDEYPHQGLSAQQAAAAMKVPDGFKVTVRAAEPDIQQPIAMAFDHRGRLWVAEAYEYPIRAAGDQGRDRILIFEDKDGDGKFDSRKIFTEGLNLVSGMEVGFGGVWVGAAPYLMFIPDRDGNDLPDGKPEILLDGWGFQDTHETLNTFVWGPDGWLYGCHGVFTHSLVGKPGMPDRDRTPINAGVWRYHPIGHRFEVFAHGTSNPWGIDFDEMGEAFVTVCVIPHLFHIIPGARYHRQSGQHFNPHTYQDIKTIAEHLHYQGATPHSGNGKSDAAGGGHAHCGAMIYQGGTWPEKYRGSIFMNNIHGQRLNVDLLKPKNSGYIGSRGEDFLLTGDMASQIINIQSGPDGNVTLIDWYDMQACHSRDATKHDRSNGRIYKVSFGESLPESDLDFAAKNDPFLAGLIRSRNEWKVRHARTILQERFAAGKTIDPAAIEVLRTAALREEEQPTVRLRAIWALHVIRQAKPELLAQLVRDSDPNIRSWALRLSFDRWNSGDSIKLWHSLSGDQSPIVRLTLASTMQSVAEKDRWPLLDAFPILAGDVADHNLPLMIWYAAEPMADQDADRALTWAIQAGEKIPLLRDFMIRRIAGQGSGKSIDLLVAAISKSQSDELRLNFLKAIETSLAGQRSTTKPAGWDKVYTSIALSSNEKLKLAAATLGAAFGDPSAITPLRVLLAKNDADEESRLQALKALAAAKDQELPKTLLSIIKQTNKVGNGLFIAAVRTLALFDDADTGPALIEAYPTMDAAGKSAAMSTLCSRTSNAVGLLRAVAEKKIPVADLSADLARQLEYLNDAEVKSLLDKVWGQVRQSPAEKLALIEKYKGLVSNKTQPAADLQLGRAIFAKTCQRCHVMYGVGQNLGPDLTGSNRANLDYLLENIVDPSAVMANEYRQTIVRTEDGQIITGILKAETENVLSIQTPEALVSLPKNEIEERRISEKSMMPEDQLQPFTPHEIRSLIAYLRDTKQQVPLP